MLHASAVGQPSTSSCHIKYIKKYNLNTTHKLIFFQIADISTLQELEMYKPKLDKYNNTLYSIRSKVKFNLKHATKAQTERYSSIIFVLTPIKDCILICFKLF